MGAARQPSGEIGAGRPWFVAHGFQQPPGTRWESAEFPDHSSREPHDTDLRALPQRFAFSTKLAFFPGKSRPFGAPQALGTRGAQGYEKKMKKDVDGVQFARIMRGSLRDTVYLGGLPKIHAGARGLLLRPPSPV